jgi:hypothetical protein
MALAALEYGGAMAAISAKPSLALAERRRGVSKPGHLGAARDELIQLTVALFVILAMMIGFWYHAAW